MYDAGEDRGAPYLVTEYVAGTDLARLVRDRGPLPVPEAVGYAVQAARGLHHAHQAGVVHRDVKPSNLMADRDGVVKVLDLGLARLRTAGAVGDRTAPGAVLGTAAYMAPEQATDPSAADARADVYALGCTLHYLLTGRPAFDAPEPVGQLLAHQARRPPSLRRARPDAPAALDRAFRAMVAKDPADRPQTMPDVIERLGAALARPDRYSRRWAVGAALFIAASVVAVGAGLIVRDGGRANGVGDDPPLARVPFDDPAGYQRRWAEWLGLPVEWENRAGVKLVLVPPGEFEAGSPEEEKADAVRGGDNPDRVRAEMRRAAAVRAFYLGQTEVTVAQYRRFVDESRYRTHAERVADLGEAVGYGFESGRWVTGPGYKWDYVGKEFRLGPDHPVLNVTWEDAVEYCRWLTGPGAGDAVYRLPTEDEWEYACRAGSAGPWCHGESPDAVPRFAACGRPVPQPVAGNRWPNGFGLFDMHGNMPEWCLDLAGWPDRPYPGGRVLRGGRFNGAAAEVRSAAREWAHRTSPLGGFRVVAEPPADPAPGHRPRR